MVGYIGAPQGAAAASGRHSRTRDGLALSLAFFAGLTLTLTVLGALASVVGRVLTQWKGAFALGAAALTFAAGVAALFGPPFRRRVPNPDIRQRGGIVGSFVYGGLFSVATITTSAAPLLLLLTAAAALGRPWYGAALSLAYGVGRGVPFLVVGAFAQRLKGWLESSGRARRTVEVLSGVALLALSFYFVLLSGLLHDA